MIRAFAPGRVNLIGDHTDYTGGYVLPMAVQLGTTVTFDPGGPEVRLVSADDPEPAVVRIDVADPAALTPGWAQYVAAVVAEVRPAVGGRGQVRTTLPLGAGLSSSAALEVAVACALGLAGPPLALAQLCQRAEQRASGVPCGIMDQLASAAGVAGHALLIDCATNDARPVPLPEAADVVAVHSGQSRRLATSAYAARRAECEAAAALIGPLRLARSADVETLAEARLRRRARHVVTENARVLAFAAALGRGELPAAGAIMDESHASLRDDFEVSSPALDALVARLQRTPGVFGARLTGAGFGGCAVALAEPGALREGWHLTAVGGAHLF
ncbi:MAG TPA: galactokinase [Acidimicrobiales bacterium]|jgi:galactokinase|nr:galactokinase [Acidimicrobiales bacterium]